MEKVRVKITDIGYDGEGIGRINGKVCFVPFALPGETIDGNVCLEKSKFVQVMVRDVVQKSKDRVKPHCKYYGVCGGCALEHLDYAAQLEYKKMLVARTLKKYADVDCDVLPVLSSNNKYGYRNKVTLFVSFADGKVQIGLYKVSSHDVVGIERCEIVKDEINDAIMRVRKCVEKNVNLFSSMGLKAVMIRAVGSGRQIVFVCDKFKKVEDVGQYFEDFDDVFVCENKKSANLTGRIKKLFGSDALIYKQCGITASVWPKSFLQVNDEMSMLLYEYVANLVDAEVVINAYSGAGLLSAMIAKSAKKVIGIEINKDAHKSAEELKIKNKIENLTNICGDCKKLLAGEVKSCLADAIVLDPPRAGVGEETMRVLDKSGVKNIIYISCNPATLARDLKSLTEYSLKSVQPLDMFPETPDVETVVKLEKIK